MQAWLQLLHSRWHSLHALKQSANLAFFAGMGIEVSMPFFGYLAVSVTSGVPPSWGGEWSSESLVNLASISWS